MPVLIFKSFLQTLSASRSMGTPGAPEVNHALSEVLDASSRADGRLEDCVPKDTDSGELQGGRPFQAWGSPQRQVVALRAVLPAAGPEGTRCGVRLQPVSRGNLSAY